MPSTPDDDAWLTTLRDALAMRDAPPGLIDRVLASLPSHGNAAAGSGGALRRWMAVLARDSWAQPALGLRDVAADTRLMLFTADERDIDLRIVARGESFQLCGQHLGPDGEGRVELLSLDRSAAASPSRTAVLNDMGEFALDDVQAGTYLLTLRVGSDEIVLPPIDVGAAPSGRRA